MTRLGRNSQSTDEGRGKAVTCQATENSNRKRKGKIIFAGRQIEPPRRGHIEESITRSIGKSRPTSRNSWKNPSQNGMMGIRQSTAIKNHAVSKRALQVAAEKKLVANS